MTSRKDSFVLKIEAEQDDPELCVLDLMVQAMSDDQLSNGQRWRILDYLQDRFGKAPLHHGHTEGRAGIR